jgi:hypothetical protein
MIQIKENDDQCCRTVCGDGRRLAAMQKGRDGCQGVGVFVGKASGPPTYRSISLLAFKCVRRCRRTHREPSFLVAFRLSWPGSRKSICRRKAGCDMIT